MHRKAAIIFVLVFWTAESFVIKPDFPKWDISALNTASEADYLTENEKNVILEINKLRSDPQAYCREYLEPMLNMYTGKKLIMPGNDPILTQEGISALKNAILYLKKAAPVSILYPDARLKKSARDHQQDQSKSGGTGHVGSDGSNIRQRIERYVKWQGSISENIFYGDGDARSVVLHLVIDDGVPGRGHRVNFLAPGFNYVGVSCGVHKTYRNVCVMNFATGFKTDL